MTRPGDPRREGEGQTEFAVRAIRNEIVEQCAAQAEWFANVEKFTIEDVALRIRQMKT